MEKYNSPLYMTKRDFLYRVPSNEDVNRLWEKVLQFRRENGIKLCLKDQEKKDFFFSLTEELKKKVVEVDDLSKNNFFEDFLELIYFNAINGISESNLLKLVSNHILLSKFNPYIKYLILEAFLVHRTFHLR